MQRPVGRRTLEGVMGLQNDLTNLNRRNSFLTSLRGRSHDTSGDKSTLPKAWDNQEENFVLQRYDLYLLEEKCDLEALRIASYKRGSERYFNSNVKEMRFKEGDLVLRKINSNTKEANAGVLGPNWEGPNIIEGVVRPGTYKLKWPDGSLVPRTWNAEHLKPYYQ